MQKLFVLVILVASTLGLAGSAYAYDLSAGSQTYLASDRTINGSYYAAGNSVDINGAVTGDVFCAGQNVTINGPVSGDVICAAQNITINGAVGGSVRIAAQTVNLSGKIGRNASVVAQTLATSKDSSIAGELMAQASTVTLNGTVVGESYGSAQQLTINGNVGSKVSYAAEAVMIGSTAKLDGGLQYTSRQKADVKAGAQITGDTRQSIPKTPDTKRDYSMTAFLAGFLFNLFSALVLGILLIWLVPKFIAGAATNIARPGLTLLLGFAALILTPIAAIMIMLSVIGIPAAILALVIWGIALFLSRIVAALALGTVLYGMINKDSRAIRTYVAGALGILVAFLIFALPYVGGFASFLAALYGLGIIVRALNDHIRRKSASISPQVHEQ